MSKCKVICMAFDGETMHERPEFDTPADAWEYSGDLGSKWYFYPFHFVTTASGKTIVESPDMLEFFNGKRLGTVQKAFEKCAALPEAEGMSAEAYLFFLNEICN